MGRRILFRYEELEDDSSSCCLLDFEMFSRRKSSRESSPRSFMGGNSQKSRFRGRRICSHVVGVDKN